MFCEGLWVLLSISLTVLTIKLLRIIQSSDLFYVESYASLKERTDECFKNRLDFLFLLQDF